MYDNLEYRLKRLTDRLDAWETKHEREIEGIMGFDDLASIRGSKESAVEMLKHHDPQRRIVALEVLRRHWKVAAGENCLTTIVDMASSDPDVDVRARALSALGACYRGTDDSRIGRLLASIVRNVAYPRSLRYYSYLGLLQLQCKSPVTLASFPENLDHAYIDDFLRENRIANSIR